MSAKTKFIFQITCYSFVLLALILPFVPAHAEDAVNIAINSDIQNQLGIPVDLSSSVVKVVQYVIGFLALISVVLLIYAGFTWLTAAGNEEKIATAKKTITAAVAGIAVILLAGAIVAFVSIGFPMGANIKQYQQDIYGSDTKLADQIVNIIKWVLLSLALIAAVMIIYGGFVWLTAAGNEERVSSAKKTISAALIGLAIILLAWAITWFVTLAILKGSAPAPPPGP